MKTRIFLHLHPLSHKFIPILICTLWLAYPNMGLAEVIKYPTDGSSLLPSPSHPSDGDSLSPLFFNTSNNFVTVSGGTISGHVYGGQTSVAGDCLNNTVTISGGTIGHSVWGSYTNLQGNNSFNHIINISGGDIGGSVYGGYVDNSVQGNKRTGSHTITMTGGTVRQSIFGAYADSGTAPVPMELNNIFISNNALVLGDVKAAYSSSDRATLEKNSVSISNAKVHGGVMGGDAVKGLARSNTVSLTNSAVGGDVLGSHALTNSTNSSITISGSTVGGDIYAGRAGSFAKDNSLTIADTAVGGTLYGNNDPSGTWGTDNNILNSSGMVSASGVQNFQHASIASGELNVTGSGTAALAAARFQNLNNNGRLSFFNNSLDQFSGQVLGAYSGSGSIGLEVSLSPNSMSTDADRIEFASKPNQTVAFFSNP